MKEIPLCKDCYRFVPSGVGAMYGLCKLKVSPVDGKPVKYASIEREYGPGGCGPDGLKFVQREKTAFEKMVHAIFGLRT